MTNVSESEWVVLKMLWMDAPVTLAQLTAKLKHTGWSPKTIQTFLSRLVKKGVINAKKQGRGFLYSPIVKEKDCQIEETKRFIDRIFDGSYSKMVLGAIDSGSISDQELKSLKKLINEHEAKDANDS